MKKKCILWFSISLFVVFSVFFYGPLGMYLSNSEEFWFSPWDLLKIISIVSGVIFLVMMLFGLILPEKFSVFFAKLAFGGGLALYIQGNYINISYGDGVLDGTQVIWSDYTKYAVINTIVWLLCILLPFAVGMIPKIRKAKFDRKIIVFLSAAIIAMQLPALAVQIINYRPNEQQNLRISPEGFSTLSSGENVVVFVVDTLDEAYYQQMIDAKPEFAEKFRDFVHYDNFIASGARTMLALPSMLTGKPFKKEQLYSEYTAQIWNEDNVLKTMHDQGDDVRVFSETMYFCSDNSDYIENFSNTKTRIGSWKILAKKIYKLTGSVFAPHLLKKYVWFNTAEFDQAKEKLKSYSDANISFLKRYRKHPFKLTDDYSRAFRLYHMKGAHQPFKLDENGEESNDATILSQTIAVMNGLCKMIDDMKNLGVYDDATIIITADHGDLDETEWAWGAFLIKEAHHTGDYTVSHAPLSGFDLPLIIADTFGGSEENEYGMHLSDISEATKRERHFFKNTSGSSRVTVSEFVTDSDAGDMDAFIDVCDYESDVYEPYVMGETLSFTADATGNAYAVSGFDQNTGFRTILCGRESVLKIPISDLPEEGRITVHIITNSYSVNGYPTKIYVGDTEVYSGKIRKDMNNSGIEFEVPIELLHTDEGDVLNLRMIHEEIEEGDTTTGSYGLRKMWITADHTN